MRSNQLAMKMQTTRTRAQRAAEYLKRVAAVTGAERIPGSVDAYWLRAGRKKFLVQYKCVRAVSRDGKSTCFSVAADPDMPSAEVVACALLHLKNNPKVFQKWRKQPGRSFKANGKVFKDLL